MFTEIFRFPVCRNLFWMFSVPIELIRLLTEGKRTGFNAKFREKKLFSFLFYFSAFVSIFIGVLPIILGYQIENVEYGVCYFPDSGRAAQIRNIIVSFFCISTPICYVVLWYRGFLIRFFFLLSYLFLSSSILALFRYNINSDGIGFEFN